MNQRHSNEGPNPGFGSNPSHGSGHEQQPGGQSWEGNQGGQQSARDYGSSHQDLLDPDYQQWRSEQMRSFDDDYRNWRQERFRRFSDDFTNWRKGRIEQGSGTGEDRSAVLVAGPGSRSGSSPHEGDQTERQIQSGQDSASKQSGTSDGSTAGKTK